ncbi:MAG: hypothetical protein MPJ25_05790, partial [Pirellulales bacterium]|nr:hypothetical protein [Pirellulales bacterium]
GSGSRSESVRQMGAVLTSVTGEIHQLVAEARQVRVSLYPMFRAGTITSADMDWYIRRLDNVALGAIGHLAVRLPAIPLQATRDPARERRVS